MTLRTSLQLLGALLVGIIAISVLPMMGGMASGYAWAIALLLSIVGFFISAPLAKSLSTALNTKSVNQLRLSGVGLLGGLLGAYLLQPILTVLPGNAEAYTALPLAIILGLLGAALFFNRDIPDTIQSTQPVANIPVTAPAEPAYYALLDTSVIIDGRIADICKTGFIQGKMLVPRFVLHELQHVADSADPLRRGRGRRGLEILKQLQQNQETPIEITEQDVSNSGEVDAKLVALGKHLGIPVMTNDYNLNRVAAIQGVYVLNVNELANAIKSVYLPGESLNVRVIQEGKEHNQGIAYLDDGTMIVVENGERYINRKTEVVVTKILQTAAGRMIFAKPI